MDGGVACPAGVHRVQRRADGSALALAWPRAAVEPVWSWWRTCVFALLLIHFTGGARSMLFLALLLIARRPGLLLRPRRGLGVALAASAAYVLVVWPTIDEIEWANTVIRLVVLLGTAVGVGILAQVEQSERAAVAQLTGEAQAREQFIRSVVESLGEGVVTLDLEGPRDRVEPGDGGALWRRRRRGDGPGLPRSVPGLRAGGTRRAVAAAPGRRGRDASRSRR